VLNFVKMPKNHALIFGASGISGWAITNQILNGYPSPDRFSRVTALTNRPLSAEASLWPQSEKLQMFNGIDLMTTSGQKGLEVELKSKIKGIEEVSHVFFFGMSCNRTTQGLN
jgi:hypothetical protein